MARGGGGRSHASHRRGATSRFSRTSYGAGRYRGTGGGGGTNLAAIFETIMDAAASRPATTMIANGALYISGNQKHAINQLDNFSSIQPQVCQNPMEMMNIMPMFGDFNMMPQTAEGMPQQMDFGNNSMNTNPNQPLMNESLPGQMVQMQNMNLDPNMMNPNMMAQPQMMMPQPMMMAPPPAMVIPTTFSSVNVGVIGNKINSYNTLCYILTIFFAACLIFPLCFMYCMWWKNLVYPRYEVSQDFYRSVNRFIKTNPSLIALVISVCDNCFNQSKARMLYEGLEGSQIKTFTFVNSALEVNSSNSQYDNFAENIAGIKSLPLTSTLIWGTTVK